MGALPERIRRLARRRQWTAAILLSAYAFASVLGGLHLAIEAHSLCAHGELTHAAVPCASEDGVAHAPAFRAQRAPEAPEDERGDVHEHCEWVGRACQERATSGTDACRAAERAAVPVDAPREDRAQGSVPLLALAPHHGPPRRV
ncbi:MAG TPA: hypothetical protein VMT18_14410 [Planctomycetota bacterium]|nr:hypothetical protein [Planctomycetota bacterium]